MNDAAIPAGAPETLKTTLPALPAVTAVEIVLLPPPPGGKLKLPGDALMLKSGWQCTL